MLEKIMEKILLAIDAVNLNMPALDFACYIGRLTNSKVTGVFLENLVADKNEVLRKAYSSQYAEQETDEVVNDYLDKGLLIEKIISIFKEACETR